ncbi:MAG: hypothetical protein IV107_01890 [Paucibacter sp.]|nr:hypothetical protein [Roseateles sp.]
MKLRIWPALFVPCMLLSVAAAADDEPPPRPETAKATAYLNQVQLQGVSSMPRERKTLAQILKAQTLFQQHRQLAPQATLTYRVYARLSAADLPRADLALLSEQGRVPIPLDPQQRFVADPAWAKLDPELEIRSKLADGRVTWRPDIRTPGWPDAEQRLGDLRLQCRVAFASGLARTDPGWIRVLSGLFGSNNDECNRPDWSPSNFAERPIFSVSLVHGERRLRLNQRNLHGLFDDQGSIYDWGFLLRDRMFRVPLGDPTWPDETRVVFEYMDSPEPAVNEGLAQSNHPFAAAARSLQAGQSEEEEIRALMGKAKLKVLRFESGLQIWRYWQAGAKPAAPSASAAAAATASPMAAERGTELVLLLNAEGQLQKLAFTERR